MRQHKNDQVLKYLKELQLQKRLQTQILQERLQEITRKQLFISSLQELPKLQTRVFFEDRQNWVSTTKHSQNLSQYRAKHSAADNNISLRCTYNTYRTPHTNFKENESRSLKKPESIIQGTQKPINEEQPIHSHSPNKEEDAKTNLKQEFERLKQQHKKLQQQIADLKGQIDSAEKDNEELIPRYTRFFEGDVLDGFDDYKEKLTELIEANLGKIKRTRLLYRYEKNHPRNLHPFLDGQAPFVLLVKNKAGDYHFACVSEGAVAPNLRQHKRGWLMALSKRRVYAVASDKPAVQYDGTYLIIGNQQVRIEGQSDRVFSNFGINNSYYNTTGLDVKDFIGPGVGNTPRQAEIDCFQIFKVIF